jgi:hypothetical protein
MTTIATADSDALTMIMTMIVMTMMAMAEHLPTTFSPTYPPIHTPTYKAADRA